MADLCGVGGVDVPGRGEARERARSVVLGNKDVPFVNRLLHPNDYPIIKRGERDATVELFTESWPTPEEAALKHGGHWAIPSIVLEDGRLVERGEGDAGWGKRQVLRGNAIRFPTLESAEEFAKGDNSWKLLLQERGGDLIPRRSTELIKGSDMIVSPATMQRLLQNQMEARGYSK